MTHLDEGTIHAWLDRALSDAESREVSEHTASCAQCGALVAEARGLIAGASRILTSLDDVPAGVTPKRAPVVATGKPAQRLWQAAPWVTGIAAALILAIGVKEWRDRPSAKAALAPVSAIMDSLRRFTLPQASQVDSASRPEERRALTPVSAPPAVTDARMLSRARAAAGVASGAGARAADVLADAPRAQGELAKKEAVADALQPSAKLVPAPAAPATAQVVLESAPLAKLDTRALLGCYRLSGDVARETSALGATRALAAREPRPTAPSAASGLEQPGPAIVRLDSTATVGGRVVASVVTGANLGTWTPTGGDSIRLVMQLGAGTIATSRRVACPPSPQE